MKRVFISFAMIAMLASCHKNSVVAGNDSRVDAAPASSAVVTVTQATTFNDLFTRNGSDANRTVSAGGGWTGGDAGYSILLPNNKHLWLFGDSFLGQVNGAYPNRTRPTGTGGVQLTKGNVAFTQNTDGTVTTYKDPSSAVGSNGAEAAYIKTNVAGEYFWPFEGYYNSGTNKVYVLLYRWKSVSGNIQFLGTWVARISYPALAVEAITNLNKGTTVAYGSAVMLDGGYAYIYGSETSGSTKYLHVARVLPGSIENTNAWEHYIVDANLNPIWHNNNPSTSFSIRIHNGNSNEVSVHKNGTNYYLITMKPGIVNDSIFRYKSSSPVGPFNNQLFLYKAPAPPSSPAGNWRYNAKAHPAFVNGTQLLISYCTNNTSLSNVYSHADSYRPYFIWVSGWQ